MDTEAIRDILIELGYRLDDRGDYWQTNAIYRGGDNRTAVQYIKTLEYGRTMCRKLDSCHSRPY